VKFPLAAGIQQAIGDEGFEHLQPRRAFLRVGQQRLPEGIEIEAVPEFESKPATTPLARAGQSDVTKVELDRGMFEVGCGGAVFGEKVDLADLVAFIDRFDGAGPGGAVAVVDLAEIEQGFLNGPAACDAAVFDDTPVAVLLAVLESLVRSQKHDPAWSIPQNRRACPWGGSPPQAFPRGDPRKITGSSALSGQNSAFFPTYSESRANRETVYVFR
jgi:hypothetical protein